MEKIRRARFSRVAKIALALAAMAQRPAKVAQ
jgi:hypothetical protein